MGDNHYIKKGCKTCRGTGYEDIGNLGISKLCEECQREREELEEEYLTSGRTVEYEIRLLKVLEDSYYFEVDSSSYIIDELDRKLFKKFIDESLSRLGVNNDLTKLLVNEYYKTYLDEEFQGGGEKLI